MIKQEPTINTNKHIHLQKATPIHQNVSRHVFVIERTFILRCVVSSNGTEQNQAGLIGKRRRRSIFSDIGNFFKKNIIDPVVDTVKDIVKTPIQIGKAIGAAISGDTEQAK